jgi:hypothetical protein
MLLFIKRFVLFFLVFLCIFVFSQTHADVLTDRIKNEAPEAWRVYFRSWNNFKVEYREKITEGNVSIEDKDCSMFLSYPCMIHQETDNVNHSKAISVFNSQYRFRLEKNKKAMIGCFIMSNQFTTLNLLKT